MRLATLIPALALLLTGPARAADPSAEAARSYTLEASAAPRSLRPGASGTLTIAIAPLGKTHVHPQAPLKVTLSSSAGLTLGKTSLGRADVVDAKAEGPRFQVPFTAAAAGAQELRATVDFFICSDQWCVKQVRQVAVPVDVP